jgi:hypothetical protein
LPEVPVKIAADCGTDPLSYMAERPWLTVFKAVDGDVYMTYSTTARGLEAVMTYYRILDLVPNGRNEGEPSSPLGSVATTTSPRSGDPCVAGGGQTPSWLDEALSGRAKLNSCPSGSRRWK